MPQHRIQPAVGVGFAFKGVDDGASQNRDVTDGINGVVWHDDTQVADLQVRRRYGARPGVEMVVMTLECEQ